MVVLPVPGPPVTIETPLTREFFTAGGLTQGVGYVIFWYFLFGKAAAIAAIPGLAFQAISGIIIAFVISEALQKTSLRRHFIYSTDGKGAAEC